MRGPRAHVVATTTNENLTAYRRRIVKEANKRRQEGTLLSVWTLDW